MSESGSQSQPDDALVDLLVKQATEGLSPSEQRALDAMDSASATQALREFERAAAAIALAAAPVDGAVPAALRARIEKDAQGFFASRGAAAAPTGVPRGINPREAVGRPSPAAGAAARPGGAGLAWFAAAACLLLALFAWFRSPTPPAAQVAEVSAPSPVAPIVTAPSAPAAQAPLTPPTPAEERAAMLARPDTIKVVLGATKDPAAAGVTGDAVWDPVAQKGFLHFVGLAANDPSVRQYQIWIFDGARDKRYPVDGGVFDVPANATEAVIPVRADLPIRQAKGFAVTVEKPGGVVVSGLKHVLVLGTAG